MKRIAPFILLFLLHGLLWGQEGKVTDLKIQGNKKIKSEFVKHISRISAGQTLDTLAIEEDIRLLKRLPAIAHAYYQVFPDGTGGYNVFYNIEENFTIIPSVNFYTSDDDEFAYRLGLYEFNLFGRAINFGGFYQKDIYDSYGINFRAPYLFGRNLGLAINYQDLTTQEPVFFDNTTADYKYNNESYEIVGLYQFNLKTRIELGLNYFTETYDYKSGATSPDVPQNLQVKKLLYKGVFEYNNLNFHYQYVEGFRSIFNFQYVTSRDIALPDFTIGWNDFLYFKRVGERGNWGSRLRLGVATNNDTPFAPFSVDNNLNIRGVGNTIDRGTAAIVLNMEYRHSIIDKKWFAMQTNVFVDGGSWRNPGGDFGDFSQADNIRIFPGVGLRFIHKKIFNAIFRIDYGVGITNNDTSGFVLGIGQYF